MSEYGPAIFISRKDKQPLDQVEQDDLKAAVKTCCDALKMVDPMENQSLEPWQYDYDGYESLAVGFVLWADYTFGQAPDFIQEDMNADAESDGKKITKELEKQFPDTYQSVCYIVEV